jgi:hypothetical protein
LDYPYSAEITLVNETCYPAKFSLDEKEIFQNLVYSYDVDESSGIIEAYSKFVIKVEIRVKRIGLVTFPIFLRITGNHDLPLGYNVTATGVGPEVILDKNELKWEKMPVLTKISKELMLKNLSPITACVYCTLVNENSCFKVEPNELSIAQGEKAKISITAYLDDCTNFSEVLQIAVGSGATHEILLTARGTGSTVVFDESIQEYHFSDVFSNRECSVSFTFYNMGRRTQHLNWIHPPSKDPDVLAAQKFEVIPSRFTLKPGSHQVVFFRGYSHIPMKIADKLCCFVSTDRSPTRKLLVESRLFVEFINPFLQITPTSLNFKSIHTRDDSFDILTHELSMKNVTSLPLTAIIRCLKPFSIPTEKNIIQLNAGDEVVVPVVFDPSHNLSRISTKENGKLLITYKEHPQKDSVSLHSEIFFPNLTFSTNQLQFGCIPNNIEQRKVFKMKNTSSLAVNYRWYFLEETSNNIDISDAFDFKPVRGTIQPQETEEVEVYFYGCPNTKFTASAICDVSGGPKYELRLGGEGAEYKYSFDCMELNFGSISYQAIAERDLFLYNTGNVAFDFNASIDYESKLSKKLLIYPSSGVVSKGGKQKFVIRFCPSVPEGVQGSFFIQIAHFEPTEIKVNAEVNFPNISFNIPKAVNSSTVDSSAPDLKNKSDMDRKYLSEITFEYLDHQLKLIDENINPISCNFIGSTLLFSKGQIGKNSKENKAIFLQECSLVTNAVYICDLGVCIKNTSTRKLITISNIGSQSVSFSLSKTVFAGSGFLVEPEKVKNLPAGESVDLTVTFIAKSDEKTHQIEFPIYVQGGPINIVRLMAGISIPSISLSKDGSIDFGEVLVGYRKSIMLQLCNTSQVPSEWCVRLQSDENPKSKGKKQISTKIKDFDLVPSNGIIQPNDKIYIILRFFPSEQKLYDVGIPLKISMNPKPFVIKVIGQGINPNLIFDPPFVDLGPVLPFAENSEIKITIENPTSHPFEFYSVDFDTNYKHEEEILKQFDVSENGTLYLQPKDYAVSYFDYLTEQLKKVSSYERELESTGKKSTELERYIFLFSNTNAENQTSSEPITHIILHGPPFCGRTTQSKRIAAYFRKKLVSWDEIIESSTIFHEQVSKKVANMSGMVNFEEDARLKDEFKSNFSEDIFMETLKQAISSFDYKAFSGFVIDGLESKYPLSIPTIVKGICKFLIDRNRKLIFFHLSLDLTKVRDREMYYQSQLTEQELSSLRVTELSEDTYDCLTDIQKASYDESLLKYKKRLKEIEDDRIKERRLHDNDRQGERKIVDERKPKDRRIANARAPVAEKGGEKPINQSSTKGGKKGGSPKLGKRTQPEKVEKHADKEIKHTDRDFMEDPLSEIIFIKDGTVKRVEQYLSTLDSIISTFKDGKELEKSATLPTKTAQVGSIPVDKKIKPQKGLQLELVATNLAEENSTAEEPPSAEFHEINAGILDEEATFKALSEYIPVPAKLKDNDVFKRHLHEYLLEKIITIPSEREIAVQASKFFSISYLNNISEIENDPNADATPAIAHPKIIEQKPEKIDSKKGSKTNKVSDDKANEPDEEIDREVLNNARWLLNAGEKKDFLVRFYPIEAAKYQTQLSFDVVGGGKLFSLPCTGVCEYSQIVVDYKRIFQKVRKSKQDKEIIHGEFILSTNTFEFGPLLYNKPKDKFGEMDNRATFNIINAGNSEIKVDFILRFDLKGDTFNLDPSSMTLAGGKSQPLNVTAFPKAASFFEDNLIICIQDNPDPLIFKLNCVGVRPELEIDRRTLAFDRLLLGRSEKKEIKLKNPTYMPVSWRFVGLESLGDEFEIEPSEGQVESFDEMIFTAEFKASKALTFKKLIKLEVTDLEKIAGVVQEIPILVTGESYDISMDVHFPKGLDGGIDFGTLKVLEEGKQLVTLKNRGKYEVGFRFLFDTDVSTELMAVSPPQGLIQPSEKPFLVQIVFKSPTEILLKDFPAFRCIVFEPSTGEVTASITVKVCVKAVFSKFTILPVRDLNFGALIQGTKISKQIILENTGEFDFKFSIFKSIPRDKTAKLGSAKASNRVRPTSPPLALKNAGKKDIVKLTDALSFGVFSISPTNGVVTSGTKQIITVDFHTDFPGVHEESIWIDISDRAPQDNPDVLDYQLIGESCVPGINNYDFASIFEEQTVCRQIELFKSQSSVYCEEERVFYYGAYLAGEQGHVQFKISNPFKVACDVVLVAKPRGKTKTEAVDFAFDVEPKKLSIPSHEHRYVSVSFHPSSIQNYSGIFEATVENVSEGKNRCLTFELRGEGTLPRITIEKPFLRSKAGNPWLKFRRLLVGSSQTLSIVLKNDGIIPANFKIEWNYKDNDDFFCNSLNNYHCLKPGETRSIDVKCQPSIVRKLEGELKLKVMDNSFEDSFISVSGDGYIDDFTIEGLGDEVENEIAFFDCYIGEIKGTVFRVKNHSSETVRAVVGENPDFTFAPSILHIAAGDEKDIEVSICPKQPLTLQHACVAIKVSKIRIQSKLETNDWDDRMKIIKWANQSNHSPTRRIVETLPEPSYELIQILNEYQLFLNVFADYSNYECEIGCINFKKTLMFQSRVFRFPLKNTGKVSLTFSFALFDDENLSTEIDDSIFSIMPVSGKIQPGEFLMLTAKFSPSNVGDYKAYLTANLKNLQRDQKDVVIQLSGVSIRPFCHFELEDIDPLSLENRTPERCSRYGVPFALDPSTKIIEFISCGIKTKSLKRFYIINPTESNYEYQWNLESTDTKEFKCLTPRGVVAPNKKSEIIFEFQTETLDTKVIQLVI